MVFFLNSHILHGIMFSSQLGEYRWQVNQNVQAEKSVQSILSARNKIIRELTKVLRLLKRH